VPKPETVDRFRIIAEAEASEMGPIIAQLSRMGLSNINFELITDVVTFKQKVTHEVPATEHLAAWVADHPTFTSSDATRYFRESGRTSGAVYYAIRMLTEKKIIKKLGDSSYSRTDVKAIEAGDHTKEPKLKKKREQKEPPKKFAKRGEDVILAFARRNHGRFNTAKLTEVFLKEGRAQGSVYASVNELLSTNMIKRVGDKGSGQYILTTKANGKPDGKTPKPKQKPAKEDPKQNGGVPPETETEVANG
jgi:hypothetical protein